MSAMEWLLQHGEDPDVDTPLPEQEEPDKVCSSLSLCYHVTLLVPSVV